MTLRLALLGVLALLAACNAPVDPGRIAGIRTVGVISECAGGKLNIGHTGFTVFGDSFVQGDIADWKVDAALAASASAILAPRFAVVDATLEPGATLPSSRFGMALKPGTLRTPRPVDAYLILSTLWTSSSTSHVPARSFIGAGLRVTAESALGYASCQARLVEVRTGQVLGDTTYIGKMRAAAGREHEGWGDFTPAEREAARVAVLQASELAAMQLLDGMQIATPGAEGAVALGPDVFGVFKIRGLVGGGLDGAREATQAAARATCAARSQVPRDVISVSPEFLAWYLKFRCVAPV